ncbi:ATP-binding cassette domain-containing protein, partial [Salmonella enterica]|nr:ATP-binding cassette domain-containing protein [Salmonella enterica]
MRIVISVHSTLRVTCNYQWSSWIIFCGLFRDLGYRYDNHSSPVFSNLNINIAQGENVAITGPSGSGKTTLMKVLCGLFEPDAGKVIVDGQDIRQLGVNNYHKIIACVMQDDRLFSGSVRENICGFTDNIDEAWM